MTQAEDRLHRIGARDNVLVQHLVLEGSLDAIMVRTLLRKQEILARILTNPVPS
jgi:SWI/SNF-related matrix-associated actin-dependent regulator 1 of chromatin subfamily A